MQGITGLRSTGAITDTRKLLTPLEQMRELFYALEREISQSEERFSQIRSDQAPKLQNELGKLEPSDTLKQWHIS